MIITDIFRFFLPIVCVSSDYINDCYYPYIPPHYSIKKRHKNHYYLLQLKSYIYTIICCYITQVLLSLSASALAAPGILTPLVHTSHHQVLSQVEQVPFHHEQVAGRHAGAYHHNLQSTRFPRFSSSFF